MKPTEKQKCIAEQAVYGDLKVMRPDGRTILTVKGMLGTLVQHQENGEITYSSCSGCRPILRPLSDYTKEITHKGYNDNKPFIPLVELAKINWLISPKILNEYNVQNGDNGYGVWFNYKPYRGKERCFYFQIYKDGQIQAFSTHINSLSDKSNTAKHCAVCVIQIMDKLHEWHFDTRNLIASGDAISTDQTNPYEV